MRAQYSILLFIICLNISCLIIYKMGLPPVMGTSPMDETQRQKLERIVNPNATLQYMNKTSPILQINVPILGDLWSALILFKDLMYWVVDGTPHMLDYFGVPFWISWALRTLFWLSVSVMVIEFIFGRPFSD